MKPPLHASARTANRSVILLLLYSLVVAAFFVWRYQGRWLDGDTSRLIKCTLSVSEAGTLAPSTAYPFGFNYPTLSTFLSHLCGIPADRLLTRVRPFFVIMIGPVAFVLYRQLLDDDLAAAVSAFLLYLQPEFLHAVLRGSHEAVTWLSVLLALVFLSKGLRSVGKLGEAIKYTIFFYLATFASITTSVFFASSFIFGVLFSFVGSQLLTVWWGKGQKSLTDLRRLAYVQMTCLVLVFLFVFYLYAPAQQLARTLVRIADQIGAFLLQLDINLEPYERSIPVYWKSPAVYTGLTLANWFTLLTSFGVWLVDAGGLMMRREKPSTSRLLLWLLYAAFALLVGASIIFDMAGALSANLQLRLFTPFTMFTAPLAGVFLVKVLRAPRERFVRARWMFLAAAVCLVIWFSGAAMLKASTEPLLSTRWMFRTAAEEAALRWTLARARHVTVWVSLDARLREPAEVLEYQSRSQVAYDIFELDPATRYVLLSDLTRNRAKVLQLGLPDIQGAHRVYDSGSVEVYQFRPRTPYER